MRNIKEKVLIGLFSFAGSLTTAAQTLPKYDHIIVVIFENASKEVVIDQKAAPYICSLTTDSNCVFFSNSFAIKHPSQPNYIILFSGYHQKVYTDSVPKKLPFVYPNLGASLISKGYIFRGYAEDLPFSGFQKGHIDGYVRRHCPWVNWQEALNNSIPKEVSLPLTSFPDIYDSLPTVSVVIPNIFHDMHEPKETIEAISNGDRWLQKHFASYIDWATAHNSLLIVTFDEDDNKHDNHIPTLFIGAHIKGGISSGKINHYNVLRTLTDMYNLQPLGRCKNTSPIIKCWK